MPASVKQDYHYLGLLIVLLLFMGLLVGRAAKDSVWNYVELVGIT